MTSRINHPQALVQFRPGPPSDFLKTLAFALGFFHLWVCNWMFLLDCFTRFLPSSVQTPSIGGMPKMSLELTDSLQAFVDSASIQQGFVSSNEYVVHILQKEQDRDRLRALIEEAEVSPSQEIDVESYIATLRHRFHTKKDL